MAGDRRRFSRRHETFEDWDRQVYDSAYANRISRLHAQYPNRTLRALKKSHIQNLPLSKLKWDALTPKQKAERELALAILSKTRRGSDFYTAAQSVSIDSEVALRHLGNIAQRLRGDQITVKPMDHISVGGMVIYSAGEKKAVTINDSQQRSIIGQYHSAIGRFLTTGDYKPLSQFIGLVIEDEDGEQYELETDPQSIQSIKESEEEGEYFDIYSGGA